MTIGGRLPATSFPWISLTAGGLLDAWASWLGQEQRGTSLVAKTSRSTRPSPGVLVVKHGEDGNVVMAVSIEDALGCKWGD